MKTNLATFDPSAPPGDYDPVALAIARGMKQAEAARECGVSPRTVCRRMKSPEFQRQVREIRAHMLGEAAGLLAGAMGEAAKELRELIGDDEADMRFKAATKVIELGLKVREAGDVSERLAALEEALKGNTDGDRGATGEAGGGGGEGAGGAGGPAGAVPGGPGELDAGGGI